jgi:hypothetical protein
MQPGKILTLPGAGIPVTEGVLKKGICSGMSRDYLRPAQYHRTAIEPHQYNPVQHPNAMFHKNRI